LCVDRAAAHWFAALVVVGLFPCPRAPVRVRPSTKRATPGFIPPLSYRLFRAPSRSPPPVPFRDRQSARVPDPLRDITRARPPLAEPSRAPLRSVHRRSQPLDGLLRSLASRLVSSSSRVQGPIPFRGFSLCAAPSPSSGDASPLPLAARSLSEPSGSPSTPGGLGFEALFRTEKRSHRLGDEPGRWPLPSSG